MDNKLNEKTLGVGDIVLHCDDQKSPAHMMMIVGKDDDKFTCAYGIETVKGRTYTFFRGELCTIYEHGLHHDLWYKGRAAIRKAQKDWELCRWFNNQYPVGTLVKTFTGYTSRVGHPAFIEKAGGAKVWLEGHAHARGRWDLEDIEVLPETD